MTLNETQKKSQGKSFSEIVSKLKKKVLKLNKKYRPSEQAVLDLLPKLTAVALEIFSEEPFQRSCKLNFEQKEIEFKPSALICSIAKCVEGVFPREQPSRKLEIKALVEGLTDEWADIKRGDLLSVKTNLSIAPGVTLHEDELKSTIDYLVFIDMLTKVAHVEKLPSTATFAKTYKKLM